MREFAEAEWRRANRVLRTARETSPADPDSMATRAYYAAFHAVSALFLLRGKVFCTAGHS